MDVHRVIPITFSIIPAKMTDALSKTSKPEIARKTKFTFILHDPETFKPMGRFSSSTPSLAAKKAASRGFTDVHLRKAGTKMVSVYECSKVPLDTPKVIKRGDVTVTFKTVSKTKLIRRYIYSGDTSKDDNANVPENPTVVS